MDIRGPKLSDFDSFRVNAIVHQRQTVSLRIRIENEYFIFPTLIDFGPDISNMIYIDKVPAKFGHPTHLIIHAVGSSSMVMFEIPIAQVCTNQYKLDVNFYLMKLNSYFILGNPFLTTAEPHGITSVRGIKGLYLIVEQEHKSMFLPLISK